LELFIDVILQPNYGPGGRLSF